MEQQDLDHADGAKPLDVIALGASGCYTARDRRVTTPVGGLATRVDPSGREFSREREGGTLESLGKVIAGVYLQSVDPEAAMAHG